MAWLAGYTKRKKITIDNTYVDADLTDFPLLVKFSSDTDIGGVARSDGYDLRFTSSDGTTLLKYEREAFSISGGAATGIVWVKVPSVSGSVDTDIYLYYGDAAASDGADAANTWDANFKSVWHGKDATTSTIADSKSGLTGTKFAANEPVEAAGKINKAQSFDGSNDTVDVTDNAAFQFERTDTFTFSAWVKTSHSGFNRIFHKSKGSSPYTGYWFGKYSTNVTYCELYDAEGDRIGRLGTTAINDNAWRLIHVTYSGNSANSGINLYVNGADDDVSDSSGGTFNSSIKYSVSALIGADTAGGRWSGSIGEIRVSSSVRTAAWIKFEYRNAAEADNEIALAAQEVLATDAVVFPRPWLAPLLNYRDEWWAERAGVGAVPTTRPKNVFGGSMLQGPLRRVVFP